MISGILRGRIIRNKDCLELNYKNHYHQNGCKYKLPWHLKIGDF